MLALILSTDSDSTPFWASMTEYDVPHTSFTMLTAAWSSPCSAASYLPVSLSIVAVHSSTIARLVPISVHASLISRARSAWLCNASRALSEYPSTAPAAASMPGTASAKSFFDAPTASRKPSVAPSAVFKASL